jgi:cell division protease FtsH
MGKESWLKAAVVWIAIIALFVLSFKFFYKSHEDTQVQYSQLLSDLEKPLGDAQSIIKVNIRADNIRGDEIIAKLKDDSTLTTYGAPDDGLRAELRKVLEKKNVPVDYLKPEEGNVWWASFFTMWLPLILVIGFMVLFLRNMQGAGGKALSFGRNKAKLHSDSSQKVKFKDVAGVDEAKEECAEIVSFLRDHKRFQDIGARIPRGVLMMGPPGTGKTLLARAIAGEAGVPFFHISGSDFVEMFVGVGASRVRDLFENAKKNSPCIVFIDEIDAVGRHRGAGVGGGHDEREQTLNQLLVEMDGFESNEAIIVIAATNRADVLDPALLRPGRFDRRVMVGLPDSKGRKEILDVHVKKVKTADSVSVEKIALGTPGFSGADLENLVNEAALLAARKGLKKVSEPQFEEAKDKLLMGPERKSAVLPKATIEVTAYHEAGHALVAHFLKAKENVHKITVIPRGQALGATSYLPEDDVYGYSKEDLLIKIAYAMGGRAAEELKFKQFTTGASNDIQQATDIARKMVCEYGMSKLGPVNFGSKGNNPFLGRELGEAKSFSEQISYEIDTEVSQIINIQYEKAKKTLEKHMDIFENVSKILFELETLESEEFKAIVDGAAIEEIKNMKEKRTAHLKEQSSKEGIS